MTHAGPLLIPRGGLLSALRENIGRETEDERAPRRAYKTLVQ